MNKFEFLNYIPTPGEKHLGIATVRIYGKIIFRFKIVPTKDGTSFFPAAPSVKIGEGDQPYKSAFEMDSRSEHEELNDMIKKNVKQAMLPILPMPVPNMYNQPNFFPQAPIQQSNDLPYLNDCPF
jgi:hypothetical protein